MSNDSAQGRAVGTHPGSFSGGENCRWTSWAQTDSDPLCARSGAYDSDPLDAELRKDGIEMIAPHRGNRSKPPTQDRRRLSRYMRRWLVERFFAWIQWQRRILIRWEYHAHNFLGFVQLACLVILFKQF